MYNVLMYIDNVGSPKIQTRNYEIKFNTYHCKINTFIALLGILNLNIHVHRLNMYV